MNQMHLFVRDDVLPSWWANAIQRTLSVMTDNFSVVIADGTHIQIPAAAGDGAAVTTIEGRWRYSEATVGPVAHPGGAANLYPMFITAADNDIESSPAPFTDDTNYSFGLQILAPGATPTTALFRQIGTVIWSGTKILAVRQTVGRPLDVGWNPGDLKLSLRPAADFGWVFGDGATYSRTACADLFAALGSLAGPGDGSTTFTVPNYGSRALMAAGTGASLTARALGVLLGEETHLLAAAEGAVNGNGSTRTGSNTGGATSGVDSPDHAHDFAGATLWSVGGPNIPVGGGGTVASTATQTGGALEQHAHAVPPLSIPSLGLTARNADTAHNNMQPSVGVNLLIKV